MNELLGGVSSDNLARELLSGENVLWNGRPFQGLILRPAEAFLIPFSLIWGGFVLSWNGGVWVTDAPLEFKLFGLPFLVAGIYITFGRFLIDIILRKRMIYAVTNKRIIISKQGIKSTIKSIDLKRLPALEFDERVDGSGTIRFGSSGSWFSGNNFGIWQPALDTTPQFIRITNARTVYELIQEQSV